MLVMASANERRCYNVASSPIGWAHTQNNHCCIINNHDTDCKTACSCTPWDWLSCNNLLYINIEDWYQMRWGIYFFKTLYICDFSEHHVQAGGLCERRRWHASDWHPLVLWERYHRCLHPVGTTTIGCIEAVRHSYGDYTFATGKNMHNLLPEGRIDYASGRHFKNAYELLNLRVLKISLLYKNRVFNVWVRYFVWNFKGTL